MDNKVLSIGEAGSLLMGGGLTQLTTATNLALILIGVGVAMKILVAVLQKYGINVQAAPQGDGVSGG